MPNGDVALALSSLAGSGDPVIEISQALIEALPLAVCVCNLDGRVIACNAKGRALWGPAVESSRTGGRPVDHGTVDNGSFDPYRSYESEASGDTIETGSPMARAVRSGEPVLGVELVMKDARGGHVRATASCVPLKDPHGAVVGTVNSFLLRQIQDDLEDFFEHGAIGLHLVGSDGTILRANQAELDLLGYRPDEYIGHHFAEFHVDKEAIADLFAKIGAGEAIDKYPARLRARDGSIRHVQISSSARFSDGALVNTRCFTVDVTEQLRLERELRERERGAGNLLHALPVAIYTTDASGRITFYNEAAVEFAGRRPAVGEEWCVSWKLYHPDGTPMPHAECPMAVALREARPVRGKEAVAERPDGSRVAFLAHPTPLFDDHGVLVGAVNMLVDITERKRAELALQQLNDTLEERIAKRTDVAEKALVQLHRSEHNFSLLVGSVIDYAIYMLDPDGNVTNWNAGAERIKGYRADEIIGQHFSCFYIAEERAAGKPQQVLAEALREGRYEAEGWRLRKDGSRFWANVIVDPVYDRGALLGFAKITRDVTERKESELALLESERRARGVIDTALDGFVQVDAAGQVVEWNPRAEEMFGWSRAEAIGRSLSSLIIPAAEHQHYLDSLHPVASGSIQSGLLRQIGAIRRDGNRITVELSISALHLASGELLNIFVRDLTDKILVDSRLRQAQKMEAVGQLTGGIAHDFNNLLQGIIGSLDLIQWRVENKRTGELGRFIDAALGSAKRAAAMIHRLLAFSRRQPLDPQPVKANPLIGSMEELLRRTMGEHIAIEFALAPDLWTTLCDPNQLESALLNLSINARDAMPDGGTLTIHSHNDAEGPVSAAQAAQEHGVRQSLPGFICIEVADTGTGMPPEVVERAFDPFYTTKPTGQGTGLGLSMVYGFARQSNGYCEIHSEPGHGTRIKLYLPRHQEQPVGDVASPVEEAADQDGAGEIVLVVEDDPVVRAVVVDVLDQLGYRAMEAADGIAGLDMLQSGARIDLLVSDVGLPGMNGRQMAEVARLGRPGLKVLFMTGYAEDAVGTEGFLAPGMKLITKPFDNRALAERIKKMLHPA
jgi:PAS domain S-box-containing protein